MPRTQRRNLAKGRGTFDSWATKNLKRDLAVKIRGVAHTWYEKASQARHTPSPTASEELGEWESRLLTIWRRWRAASGNR